MSPGGVYVVGFGGGRGGHEEGGEGHIYSIVCVCVCVGEGGRIISNANHALQFLKIERFSFYRRQELPTL